MLLIQYLMITLGMVFMTTLLLVVMLVALINWVYLQVLRLVHRLLIQ